MKKGFLLILIFAMFSFRLSVSAAHQCTLQDESKWEYQSTTIESENIDKETSSELIKCCTNSSLEIVCDHYKMLSESSSTSTGTNTNTDQDNHPEIFPSLGTDDIKCEKIFKDGDDFNEFGQFLQDLFLAIKVLAPAMVIILSTIDYIKAIAASNQDEVKKATQKTIKRLIIGIIVFFIPFLLDILFELFGIYDLSTCGIGS